MKVPYCPIFGSLRRTVGTRNRVGTEVLQPIHCHQHCVLNRPRLAQASCFVQHPQYFLEHWKDTLWFHAIQQSSNLVIARDLMHSEQALSIASSLRICHCPLVRQERRTLRKEHTESAQCLIFHAIARILPRALVR